MFLAMRSSYFGYEGYFRFSGPGFSIMWEPHVRERDPVSSVIVGKEAKE